METAVIGFWTILVIGIAPVETMGNEAKGKSPGFLVAFLMLHSGIFMAVHFAILWQMFAGGWAARIHGPVDFIRIIVFGEGLWLPLLVLFVGRGAVTLLTVFGPRWFPGWQPDTPKLLPSASSFARGRVLYGFYARIIVMQIALIFGGGIATALGAGAPLVLLIVLKSAIDIGLFLKADRPSETTPVAATTR